VRRLHPEVVPIDERTLERVRQLLAGRDDVEEKRMVGGRSFLVGGQLCCGVNGQGLVVRLGTDGVVRARQEPHVHPLVMGRKEVPAFAVVEPAGYTDDDALARWVSRAVATVEGSG
jgi:TfoX/Sxy family transcriptional regulator of competence genes